MDPGSSADVLFYSIYQNMKLSDKALQPSIGELVDFSGERVPIRGYIWLQTSLGNYPDCKTLDIQYLVVDYKSPYNIILGRPSLNAFHAIVLTIHLCVKFFSQDNKVVTIDANQKEARQCYNTSLKVNPSRQADEQYVQAESLPTLANLDPRTNLQDRPMPTDALTKIKLTNDEDKHTYIGDALQEQAKEHLIKLLQQNINLFAWTPTDMSGIDPNVICHRLAINPSIQPIAQKKRHLGIDKKEASLEETQKLLNAGFIKKLRFTS
ncbi:uncharacterized protein LOC107627269 [Arachis ipaensis]|uniref:uncharacterized protein LOC107627269 n=1 Tax=Arachis ipaensis TaxID=130454 RepID=UPI0007AFAED3|nr:uncharacterized protein LOC107627269 [Arachis ipaensis]XP_025635911.1 uncharacterized protein LOC112730004 [Arachis hypogaea]